jgi:hypothetical protein
VTCKKEPSWFLFGIDKAPLSDVSELFLIEIKLTANPNGEGLSTQKNPRIPSYFFEKIPKNSQKSKKFKKIPQNPKKLKKINKIDQQNDQESIFFVIDSNSPYFLLLGFCLSAMIGIFDWKNGSFLLHRQSDGARMGFGAIAPSGR